MPRACAICGKTAAYGYNVSHSKVHTHRRFDANLHPAVIDGVKLPPESDEGRAHG